MKTYHPKKEKSNKTKQILMSAFLTIIMVMSMLGIMLNQDENTTKYNDFKFVQTEKGYTSKISGKQVYFNFLPQEVEQFIIPQEFCSKLQQSTNINILFEPDSQSNMFIDYIRQDLQEVLDKPIISTVTNYSDKYSLYQVSSCEQSSEYLPTIYFKEDKNSSITIENDNCLVVQSENSGFLLLRDRIVYCYLGVI